MVQTFISDQIRFWCWTTIRIEKIKFCDLCYQEKNRSESYGRKKNLIWATSARTQPNKSHWLSADTEILNRFVENRCRDTVTRMLSYHEGILASLSLQFLMKFDRKSRSYEPTAKMCVWSLKRTTNHHTDSCVSRPAQPTYHLVRD